MTLSEVIEVLRRYDKDFLISIVLGYVFGEYLPKNPDEDIKDAPNAVWNELIHIHFVYMANQGKKYGE